eukprot:sb/3471986/
MQTSDILTETNIGDHILRKVYTQNLKMWIRKERSDTTNRNSIFRSRDWLSANQGPVFRGSYIYQTLYSGTETSKQPIRTRYLGHLTGYQPIRDQYLLEGCEFFVISGLIVLIIARIGGIITKPISFSSNTSYSSLPFCQCHLHHCTGKCPVALGGSGGTAPSIKNIPNHNKSWF